MMKFFVSVLLTSFVLSAYAEIGWKAAVVKADITPKENMLMAGFASRKHPSEGTLHKLWAKALVLEDSLGNRVVMIATDLLGMPRQLSDNIKSRLGQSAGLTKAQILINSSHTHSGPVLENALFDIYAIDSLQLSHISHYTRELENTIVAMVEKALKKLQPASIYSEDGVVRFQVNRRNNKEAILATQTELSGPNDYAVPVLKVENAKGKMIALAFGYACHPTVLDLYQWSGDYAGFAQLALEKMYPGTTALFFQGAGADQNALPRKTIPLAEQYGNELAIAVSRVLKEPMQQLHSGIAVAYKEINLKIDTVVAINELERLATQDVNYQQRWAARMLKEISAGRKHLSSYAYPVQVWRLGNQMIFGLGGELLIQYSIEIKKLYGLKSFVFGYSNDVMTYIPSELVLQEGGYEGGLAHIVYGLPAKWAPGIQDEIMNGVKAAVSDLQ